MCEILTVDTKLIYKHREGGDTKLHLTQVPKVLLAHHRNSNSSVTFVVFQTSLLKSFNQSFKSKDRVILFIIIGDIYKLTLTLRNKECVHL